ncbi:OmpA family protein [Aquimarina hainanensis]|uniref:OmpA family protein n=1 Tax=Aquimarina hainanensis TaxID=1578017 RepID=A0ABW5NEJ1_9FLAO|nr:OmpA family protein [Aquimarina sp. TRL1]QKX06298.1 OmpA family protein [Aquimarina sp. TRL1]
MMNLYTYLILGLLVTIPQLSTAQEKQLHKADEKFEQYAFVDARKIYLEVAENGYTSSDLYRRLGDSYYFNGELEDASKWYERLLSEYEQEVDPEYLFRYAQSLKSVRRYDESDQVMEKFNALTNADTRASNYMSSKDYLNFIELQSGKFDLVKLDVNSKDSDYAPSFTNQGTLVFASSRFGNSMTKTLHEWNEMRFLDLFSSKIGEDNSLEAPEKLKGRINTKFHESSTSFSKDGKTVYFTRNNYTKRRLKANSEGTTLLKLYKGTLEGDKWSNIEELPFNGDEYSVAHPALNADGTILYFASDMPGSKGLSDLYKVAVHEDGSYGTPENLGDLINTEGRETFPYISDSGRLYFASDGHVGLGGLDVFVSVPEEGAFSVPYNVGRPVNGPEDDFSFVLNEETKIGYFASNRNGGKGNDDIYSFKQTDELITSCKQYVKGTVLKKSDGSIVADAEVVLLDNNNQEINRTRTDTFGAYKFNVECASSYIVRALKEDYKPTEKSLVTTEVLEYSYDVPLEIGDSLLEVKEVNEGDDLAKLLVLSPIYFDLDKSRIRKDAEIELQKIIAALKEYPQLKIDVRSHTDSRANDAYNLALSNRRAKSTIAYIIKKGGIDPSRVTGRGYGESELVNSCTNGTPCSKEKHQLNRRSEFIIVKK